MKKGCFLIPYFGKLPNYFEVFAKSCSQNTSYDWKIFTDDETKYKIPKNVEIIKMTFSEFKKLVFEKFKEDFPIIEPHKICDYKPAFGYIFEEFISKEDYKMWGHCDLDIIVGKLDDFITDDMINTYDKMFCLGHMILYKNDYENNRFFMKEFNGEQLYLKSFRSKETTIFDETHGNDENVNSIFVQNSKKVFFDDYSFNIKILPTKFIRVKYNYEMKKYEIETPKNAVCVWDNGKVFRYYLENKKIVKEEYMYIHMQQRKFIFEKVILELDKFKIIPNKFCKLEFDDINEITLKKIRKSTICFHYFSIKNKHIKIRLKEFFNEKNNKPNN